MNEFLFLCLGLGLGMGMVGWQRLQFERSLDRVQFPMPAEIAKTKLSSLWKLRRGVAWLEENNAQLLLATESWQSIVNASPIGYLQVDRDNYLQRSNAVARKLLGLSEQATVTPRILLELVRSYELDRLIEKTRKTGQVHTRFWTFYPTSANVTEIERSQPVALCGHSIILTHGHIGVWLENQQELTELRESRDRWVSDLAHELRTPLTSIKLVAETLERHLDGTLRSWVERLVPETDRLIALVQDWLELTRPNTQQLLNAEQFALAELLDDVWRSLEPIAHRRQISLTLQLDRTFVVEGNRDRLFRVFLNLIDNAIQYSPNDCAISITATSWWPPQSTSRATTASAATSADREHLDSGGQHVAIDIIDSGSGFNPDDLPHIFERLYRGDRSRVRVTPHGDSPTRHTGGSGLGLAIVEQIVQAHNGTVSARNVPQGTGAWLQVVLPLAQSHPRSGVAAPQP